MAKLALQHCFDQRFVRNVRNRACIHNSPRNNRIAAKATGSRRISGGPPGPAACPRISVPPTAAPTSRRSRGNDIPLGAAVGVGVTDGRAGCNVTLASPSD